MTRIGRLARVALATVCLAAASVAATARDTPDGGLEFVSRQMENIALPLRNADFREAEPGPIPSWTIPPGIGAGAISLGDGPAGQPAASLDSGTAPVEIRQEIALPPLRPGAGVLSLSAWVWADSAGAATLGLTNSHRGDALSAFHSGSGRWEYLTVVLPHAEAPTTVRVTLKSLRGRARFARMTALATYDDRFSKPLPDACSPLRERTTYRKDGRIRLVVVGGSTVNGFVSADQRATFPYVLQLKLEALFPGRFDVVNFGVCAWYLPPQIVTVDKAFYLNLWCDGAQWCPQDKPFSHRRALDVHANEDLNTPTIKQLQPDVVVFAGMWNDVWRTLKYPAMDIPPNPAEVNRIAAEPAMVAYVRAGLRYLDQPTKTNRLAADALERAAGKPLDAQAVAALTFDGYDDLRSSAAFRDLAELSRRKFRYLAGEFIRRSKRYAEVWSLVLPERFGDSYEQAARRLRAAGVLSEEKMDKFLMNGYIDAETETIQSEELTRASAGLDAPSLDLARLFHAQYSGMGVSEQFGLGYFLETLDDNVHFTYRGNEWIADQIFAALSDRFAALAALPVRGRNER